MLRRAVEDWADLRLAFVLAPQILARPERLNAESNRRQTRIWRQAVALALALAPALALALARPRPDALSSLMLASLNDMVDQATAPRRAFNARIPAETCGCSWGCRSPPMALWISIWGWAASAICPCRWC